MSYVYSFRSLRHLLGVGLLAATGFRATAQTAPDTTRLSYGEEVVATPEANATLRVQPEDRSLWKLGLNNFLPAAYLFGDNYYSRYGIHLAYEHKVGKAAGWTVLGEVSPALTYYRPESSRSGQSRLGLRTQLAGRYYYNLERRLRLGRNTSNFSANYVTVALGSGVGRQARETSAFFIRPNGRLVGADVSVLYGLQRRLGRYGFIDANIGVTTLLSAGTPQVGFSNNLRIGFALGSGPTAPYSRRAVPVDTDESLQPKAYAGFQLGAYLYRVRYADTNPYRGAIPPSRRGVGTYNQEILMPYAYAGYYVQPRLAVQVGMQRQREEFRATTASFPGLISKDSITQKNDFTLPIMLRYSLTRSFLKRWQFDVVGGLVPHWSSVYFTEREFLDEALYSEYGFRRRAFGMHASAGLNASYGFGRRRRLQATTEWVLIKDLRSGFQSSESVQWGFSFLGLRYRFGYQ